MPLTLVARFLCSSLSLTTRPSQVVSAPRSVAFFPCPHLSLTMRPPGSECHLLARILSFPDLYLLIRSPESESHSLGRMLRVLTCPSQCGIQRVGATHSIACFPCPDLSLTMWSPESEWDSLALLPCPDLPLTMRSPESECHSQSLPYFVLTCATQCDLQIVNSPCSIASFLCADLSLMIRSPGSECHLIGRTFSVLCLVPYDAAFRL